MVVPFTRTPNFLGVMSTSLNGQNTLSHFHPSLLVLSYSKYLNHDNQDSESHLASVLIERYSLISDLKLQQCFSWPMRSHQWQKLGGGPSGIRSTYLRDLLCASRNISQGFITCDCALNSQSMLMNQQFVISCVHFNGNSRLPLTVQGGSGRIFCASSSDLKVTREDDYKPPSEQLSSVAGGIVALGKFDALHVGHRELAIQAAKAGAPFLLSFVGMAEVLGWEPRAPVVAKCDRKRVLLSWTPYCGEVTPVEFQVEFSKVRSLTPHQFVEKLSKKLGVRGVVAGKNYQFGYRASGDASELVRLCEEYELEAYIVNPVMDKNQSFIDTESNNSKEQGQVSSTRVRHALSKGEMRYVSELLGRQHRLMLMLNDQLRFTSSKSKLSSPKSSLLNLPPKDGIYENCCIMIGKENVIPCRVVIDTTDIRVELVDVATWTDFPLGEFTFLSIEFG